MTYFEKISHLKNLTSTCLAVAKILANLDFRFFLKCIPYLTVMIEAIYIMFSLVQ
jgi:hypothetical protein